MSDTTEAVERMNAAREEAIVRAALVGVIAKCNNQLDDDQVYWPMQFVNLVRSLASDPAEVAAIIKKAAGEDRG